MNVTMGMVFNDLEKSFRCEAGGKYDPSIIVSRACAASPCMSSPPSNKACFICRKDNAAISNGIACEQMVMIARAPESTPNCAIAVYADITPEELRDAIAGIIARYERWSSNLLQLNLHGAGLDELVDYAHNIFENPITIIDQNYRILACTTEDDMKDPLWVESSAQGRGSQITGRCIITAIEGDGFVKYLSDLKRFRKLNNYETSAGAPLSSVIAEDNSGNFYGVNIIHKNRKVNDSDLACLEFFGEIVSAKIKAIERTWSDSSGNYYALLQDVIRGNLSDADEFKQRLSENWIKIKPRFTILTMAAKKGLLRYYQLCMIEDDLKIIVPDGIGVIHSRTLVLFINHDESLEDEMFERIEEYARKYSLAVGSSESADDNVSLDELVKQAQFALRARDMLWPEKTLVRFADCRSYYLIDLCARQSNWLLHCHPCIEKIIGHDRTSTAPLYPTLRCLMQNHGNRTKTAEDLGIQRNTLQYRIAKIEEVGEINLLEDATFENVSFSVDLYHYATTTKAVNKKQKR